MPSVQMHDGSAIEFQSKGNGPVVMLPFSPRLAQGEVAKQIKLQSGDPAVGQSLAAGLGTAYRSVLFEYPNSPKPDTLTPDNVVHDLLAIADAAHADRFAWYGYSWSAVLGLQLAVRSDRLITLVMGGWPPIQAPYRELLLINEIQVSQVARSGTPEQSDRARQIKTFYQAMQDFDDRAIQGRLTCPRLCFVGSADDLEVHGIRTRLADTIIENRAELETLGWEVQVLAGLNHSQAMQPSAVLPVLKPWLARTMGPGIKADPSG